MQICGNTSIVWYLFQDLGNSPRAIKPLRNVIEDSMVPDIAKFGDFYRFKADSDYGSLIF